MNIWIISRLRSDVHTPAMAQYCEAIKFIRLSFQPALYISLDYLVCLSLPPPIGACSLITKREATQARFPRLPGPTRRSHLTGTAIMSNPNSHTTKKRRLSSSDESPRIDAIQTLSVRGETPSSSPQKGRASPTPPAATTVGFDGTLLAAIIGEELPKSVLKQLEDASGGNLERGLRYVS